VYPPFTCCCVMYLSVVHTGAACPKRGAPRALWPHAASLRTQPVHATSAVCKQSSTHGRTWTLALLSHGCSQLPGKISVCLFCGNPQVSDLRCIALCLHKIHLPTAQDPLPAPHIMSQTNQMQQCNHTWVQVTLSVQGHMPLFAQWQVVRTCGHGSQVHRDRSCHTQLHALSLYLIVHQTTPL